jgi:hypothetical protein
MKLAGVMIAWLLSGGAMAQQAAAPGPAGWLLVTDKPYEGVREYNRDQKRPDGTEYKLHETQRYWRNSAGQIREEVSYDKSTVVWTYFTDPAAKVQYRWNNKAKVAFVTKLGAPIAPREQTHPLAEGEERGYTTTVNGQRVKGVASLLPPKTIDGQETIGTREVLYSDPEKTTQISTADRWFQPQYHVSLMEDITDQQYGHRVFVWKSFKATEPKADLFGVPKGFVFKQAETAESEQFE